MESWEESYSITKGNYKGLFLTKTVDSNLYGFSDTYWAVDRSDRKSVSDGIVLQGDNPAAWFSMNHKCVALSSAESEHTEAASVVHEIVNLNGISKHLGNKENICCR